MKQRIEAKDSFLISPYIKSKKQGLIKNKSHQLLNYKTWRDSKNNHRSTINLQMRSNSKKKCSFKTLLGDMSEIRTSMKQNIVNVLKQKNNEIINKDLFIRSINSNDFTNQPQCQIIIHVSSNTKKFYHRASTTEKLFQFLRQKYPKINSWRNYPQNIALDYYLSLKTKQIGFLNGLTLSLQPYKLQKQQIININSFQIIYCIGTGGFSKVFLCRFKQDGKFYAMKVIDKNFILKNKKKKIVMNQKKIMQKLKHPFIIQMKFAFQSKSSLIFVLQLCPGGQLFGLVKKFRVMSENIAKFYTIQILLGIQQIHKNGIVYRDFKPQNILIDMQGHIRIADFGLAKPGINSIKQKAYSFCGSPQYMPPQMILKKGHSLPVDFYCLGALLYQLVTGLPPFYSQNPNDIYEGTISKTVTFPPHAKISDQLKQLLKGLLCKDQFKRLGTIGGVKQILDHAWFKKIKKQVYLNKQAQSPVRFTGIKDLNLIFSEMKIKKQEYTQDLLTQQLNESLSSYQNVMDKFYFDYRQRNSIRLSHRSKKQNSLSIISLKSNRNSAKNLKTKQRPLRSILSQRTFTGAHSIRKKPLTARCFDLNLFLR